MDPIINVKWAEHEAQIVFQHQLLIKHLQIYIMDRKYLKKNSLKFKYLRYIPSNFY